VHNHQDNAPSQEQLHAQNPESGTGQVAGRVRYRRSDIEAYEQAAFVPREAAGTISPWRP
jgi:hypothetical protein